MDAITTCPGEPLAESIERVAANALALIVKRVDISHKADALCQAGLSDEASVRLMEKYEKAVRLPGTTLEKILEGHSVSA